MNSAPPAVGGGSSLKTEVAQLTRKRSRVLIRSSWVGVRPTSCAVVKMSSMCLMINSKVGDDIVVRLILDEIAAIDQQRTAV
jgi:hypothetical protein